VPKGDSAPRDIEGEKKRNYTKGESAVRRKGGKKKEEREEGKKGEGGPGMGGSLTKPTSNLGMSGIRGWNVVTSLARSRGKKVGLEEAKQIEGGKGGGASCQLLLGGEKSGRVSVTFGTIVGGDPVEGNRRQKHSTVLIEAEPVWTVPMEERGCQGSRAEGREYLWFGATIKRMYANDEGRRLGRRGRKARDLLIETRGGVEDGGVMITSRVNIERQGGSWGGGVGRGGLKTVKQSVRTGNLF